MNTSTLRFLPRGSLLIIFLLTAFVGWTQGNSNSLSIPYFNGLDSQPDFDAAETSGFVFNDADLTFGNTGQGYIKISNGGSIVSPAIDFSAYNGLSLSFSMRTLGGAYMGQKLSVFVSNDDGDNYTNLQTFATPPQYLVTELLIDLSSLNGTNGRIKFEMTDGTNSIRFKDFGIYAPFVYSNGTWTPQDPDGISTEDDDVFIADGMVVFQSNNTVGNITINTGASLEIQDVLTITGDVMNDGDMIFKSTATKNGELGPVPTTSQITGNVTVERYMSNNRAYRMISSPVTTTSNINANWQEGATSAGDNPNPDFGTHITGSESGANGFDETLTGNPSLFTLNVASQEFQNIANTNQKTIDAGEGYLIFVRGDRGIDLTNPNPQSSTTTLRTKGDLFTGTFTESDNVSDVKGEFNLIANPYQSAVNINTVIADSQNLNSNFAYVYDPNLGDNGAYVTVDLSDGSNNDNSDANQFLQPGQAVQVATESNGPTSIVFKETAKAPGNYTSTFKNANSTSENHKIVGQLYTAENYISGGVTHDSFGIYFSEEFSNEVTPEDAVKPFNFTENLGIVNGEDILSIERRALPIEDEEIHLFSNNYNHSIYTLLLNLENMENNTVFLKDNYTQAEIQLEDGINVYTFAVDQDIEASLAGDRFYFFFGEESLSVDNTLPNYGIELYPNPTESGAAFYITTGQFEGSSANVTITDIFGKRVYQSEQEFNNGKVSIQPEATLSSGVYFVQLIQNDKKVVKRLMIK